MICNASIRISCRISIPVGRSLRCGIYIREEERRLKKSNDCFLYNPDVTQDWYCILLCFQPEKVAECALLFLQGLGIGEFLSIYLRSLLKSILRKPPFFVIYFCLPEHRCCYLEEFFYFLYCKILVLVRSIILVIETLSKLRNDKLRT